jgi:hypothetical protein
VTSTASDTREKFYTATRILASGTGPLKTRLRQAFMPSLISLRPEDFPWPDLWERFLAVREELAPNNRPDLAMERWWDFELGRIAQEIVDLYDQIARRAGDAATSE